MENDDPRSPTEGERRMLELLVSPDYPGVEAFREQIRTVKVKTDCTCGCGSFAVFTPTSAPVAVEDIRMTPTAIDHDALVDAFMFVRDGRIVGVEITYFSGPSMGVPNASMLRFD